MKLTKGCYGYLKSRKKREIIRTIVYFALPLAIFLMGYYTTGTKKNLLTVVAVLGALPASKSAVSLIMYLKAGVCSASCHEAMLERGLDTGSTLMLYDLYLTSYQKNFQISVMAVKNNVICGYTEDNACDIGAGEKHIAEIMRQNGYEGLTVKLFADRSRFMDRLAQMNEAAEKKEEKEKAIAEIIKDISL